MSDAPHFLILRSRLMGLIREESLRAMGNEAELPSGRRVGVIWPTRLAPPAINWN
jgi:hypothetical protein